MTKTALSWFTQGKRQHSYHDKILKEFSLGIRTINFSFERQKKLICQFQALRFFPLEPKRPPTSPKEWGILGLLTVCTRSWGTYSLLPVVESWTGAQPGPCADILSMAAFSPPRQRSVVGTETTQSRKTKCSPPGPLQEFLTTGVHEYEGSFLYKRKNGESLQ